MIDIEPKNPLSNAIAISILVFAVIIIPKVAGSTYQPPYEPQIHVAKPRIEFLTRDQVRVLKPIEDRLPESKPMAFIEFTDPPQ